MDRYCDSSPTYIQNEAVQIVRTLNLDYVVLMSLTLSSVIGPAFLALQASAVFLKVPVNTTIGATTQVYFAPETRDVQNWSLFLMHPEYTFTLYAILATSVDPNPGYVNVTLPATLKPYAKIRKFLEYRISQKLFCSMNYILKAVQAE